MANFDAALIVAHAADVARVRECHPTTAILALLSEGDDPSLAIANGAEYVLPKGAPQSMIEATFAAAEKVYATKRMAHAFEVALNRVSEAVEIADRRARFVWVNRAFEEMTGFTLKDAKGKTPKELIRSNVHDAKFYEQMWHVVSHEKRMWTGSLLGRRADGAVVAEIATVEPLLDDHGNIDQFVAVKRFAAPSLASISLQQEEQHTTSLGDSIAHESTLRSYRTMMSAATDAMLIADFETAKFIDVNPAACAMFGYDRVEFHGLTGRMLSMDRASASRLNQALTTSGHAIDHRHPMRRKDGSVFWCTVSLTSFTFMERRQYLAIVRDISAEVERENELKHSHSRLAAAHQQVLHSSRLAALGQMAAGIAHEINNPLQYILGGLEELRALPGRESSSWEQEQQIFGDMIEGAERIRNVTRALLPFSRVDDSELTELVDLNEVAHWAARVTANEVKHRARLELRLSAEVQPIMGCRMHIGQLITNLLTNAAHAIGEGEFASTRNSITLTTSTTDDGRSVQLVVEDTGCGMPESVRARVFEPFFTMKSSDMGTGLGLALCSEIVARHKGTIDLESTEGVGTRFTIRFGVEVVEPDCGPPGPVSSRPPKRATLGPASGLAGAAKKLRVLVIDDEEPLLRAYRRFLKDLDVVTISGGAAALAELGPDSMFDVILCDLMMPNVDGPLVHAHVMSAAPHLAKRMIFCTGGAFTPRVREFLRTVENPVLDKPLSPKELRASLFAMRDGCVV